jgi:uncharacterized protein HemX
MTDEHDSGNEANTPQAPGEVSPEASAADAPPPETVDTEQSTALVTRRWPLVAVLAAFALVIAVLAVMTSGFLWWQYRQFYVALDAADRQQQEALEALVRGQSEVDRLIDDVRGQLNAERDRIIDIRATIGDFPLQIGALEQRLNALQGRSLDARDIWLRAEAEYYLVVANTELALSGRVENAITALELADGLLRELGDPGLNPVRVAIADELAGLRAIPLTDNEGLAFSLASLADRIPALPIRRAGSGSFLGDQPDLDTVEPGIGRLWESLKQAVLGIVRIERRDEPVDVLLSATEGTLVRRQLTLELQLARIALLRGEQEGFRASLIAAENLLRADFDLAAPGVGGAAELLGELRRLEIAPARPDLTRSLNLLRASAGGSG